MATEEERQLLPSRPAGASQPLSQAQESDRLSVGCHDRVHRALTYELTASALLSPLAANSIGHRYVRLNASRQDLMGKGLG